MPELKPFNLRKRQRSEQYLLQLNGALRPLLKDKNQTFTKLDLSHNAYTITSIYHGGTLIMSATHPTQSASPGSRPEYYLTQLNTWGMTGNLEIFRQGATAYRNARDWAKEKCDEFIEAANGRMPAPYTESQSLVI